MTTPGLKTVVLIDDSESENLYHKIILERSQMVDRVIEFVDAQDALEYIKNRSESDTIDVIFLDINMPKMDGFQFMEHYAALPNEKKASIVVVMLTSPESEDDKKKANEFEEIKGFITKPLKKDKILSIIDTHFKP